MSQPPKKKVFHDTCHMRISLNEKAQSSKRKEETWEVTQATTTGKLVQRCGPSSSGQARHSSDHHVRCGPESQRALHAEITMGLTSRQGPAAEKNICRRQNRVSVLCPGTRSLCQDSTSRSDKAHTTVLLHNAKRAALRPRKEKKTVHIHALLRKSRTKPTQSHDNLRLPWVEVELRAARARTSKISVAVRR